MHSLNKRGKKKKAGKGGKHPGIISQYFTSYCVSASLYGVVLIIEYYLMKIE
jgi:hypothetical protein